MQNLQAAEKHPTVQGSLKDLHLSNIRKHFKISNEVHFVEREDERPLVPLENGTICVYYLQQAELLYTVVEQLQRSLRDLPGSLEED